MPFAVAPTTAPTHTTPRPRGFSGWQWLGLGLVFVAILAASAKASPLQRSVLFQVVAALFFSAVLLRSLVGLRLASSPETDIQPDRHSFHYLIPALLAASLTYAASLPLFFLCDDFEHLKLVRQTFAESIWPQIAHGQSDGLHFIFYRPLGFASIFLDYRLWHEWAPGYHLTNLALHLLAVAGVFFFCRQLSARTGFASASALLFAVLPVNVQAVTWIGCRFDQLEAALGIWCMAAAAHHLRTQRTASYAAAQLLFVLAVFSKESAYVLPILLLAMAWLPWRGVPNSGRHLSVAPGLGFVLTALLLWVHRLHTLEGVGGYRLRTDGSPMVQDFGLPSLIGVLLRAPAQTLFGINWQAPAGAALLTMVALTAAVLLALAWFPRHGELSGRIALFALLWVFLPALPAHFYFVKDDPGMFASRILYFSSMGLAILLALLISQLVRAPKTFAAISLGLALLMSLAAQHNLQAWRHAAAESLRLQAELNRVLPKPPMHTVFFATGIPETVEGVPFFTVGLESAVQFHYGWRKDIRVRDKYSRHVEPYAVPLRWESSYPE